MSRYFSVAKQPKNLRQQNLRGEEKKEKKREKKRNRGNISENKSSDNISLISKEMEY